MYERTLKYAKPKIIRSENGTELIMQIGLTLTIKHKVQSIFGSINITTSGYMSDLIWNFQSLKRF